MSSLIPPTTSADASTRGDPTSADVDASVTASYLFAEEGRKALKIHNRGDVEAQGRRVEEVRSKLDEVGESGLKFEHA